MTVVNVEYASANIEERFNRASTLHEQGALEAAERIYRDILAVQPDHGRTFAALGTLAVQREDPVTAIDALTRAAELLPGSALPLANLASAMLMLDRVDDALRCLSRALAVEPAFSGARYNRGCLLMQAERHAEALADFTRVLEQDAGDADTLNNCGLALLALSRPSEALERFRRAGLARPEWVTPRVNEALALLRLSRAADALAVCDAALALSLGDVEALVCRADALLDLERFEEALAVYEKALSVAPNHIRALTNAAKALVELNRHAIALTPINRALALEPRDARALNIRGVCLRRVGAAEDALQAFANAQQLPGDDAVDAAFNAGDTLVQLRRHGEAAQRFREVCTAHADRPHVLGRALHAQMLACDWSDYDTLSTHIIQAIHAGQPADAPFSFLSVSATAADQLACAKLFAPRGGERPPRRLRSAESRIRLAYVSADFHDHPVAQFAAPLLERHDRSRFEVVGVSLQPFVASEAADRLRNACERFVDVSTLSDAEAAALLRDLEIDIAVDLTGYTNGERSGILARRPALVQVSYLGYPGTSGSSFIDYLVADEFVVPKTHEQFYSESIVRVPRSFFPVDWHDRPTAPCSRADAGLPEDAFVFCGFAAPYKISPPTFDVWMRVLLQVPNSVLWLRSGTEEAMSSLRRKATDRGVDETRLVFAQPESRERHLARYAVANLFLDTFPYGAHSTAAEALRAGLPVLTCAGETFASRVAASQLHGLGLHDMVTTNFADYEARALQIALSGSEHLRMLLADALNESARLDDYCRQLERCFAAMVDNVEST